jgi:heptosyltransferase-2
VDKDEEDKIRKEIKHRAGGKSVVGIAPGAAKRTKVWDVEKTQQLANLLSGQHGMFLVFFGDATDIRLVDAICKPLKDGYMNLAGKTDFRELALYLKACDVVLSTDSGPMHVAVAVDTPVVALFGPTVREFGFRPYDEQSVTISVDLACRPCSLHGTETCPLSHHQCMKEIEVATVKEAIVNLLKPEDRSQKTEYR